MAPLRDARILVVEDDPAIASVLQRGLALHGWQVEIADDGLTGRAAWDGGAYDAVILDVMLPGVNGIELCALRRAAGDLTPVLLLTARDDQSYRAAGEKAGADAYLTKPFAYRDLLTTLERILAIR
ncbi:MAG: response regulator [Chloroflexota bacterium]|nr:response regulator [Chloroflexota bacterium]